MLGQLEGVGAGRRVGQPRRGQGLVVGRLGPPLGLGTRLGQPLGLVPRLGPPLGLGPQLGPTLGLGPRLGPSLGLGPLHRPHRLAVHRLLVCPPAPLALTRLNLWVGEGLQGRRAAPRSPRQLQLLCSEARATNLGGWKGPR